MSAYIVDRATIHALVHAAIMSRRHGSAWSYYWDGRRYDVSAETADETGEMLTRENVRSVRYRYPNSEAEDLPGRVDLEWAAPYIFPLYDSMRWPRPTVGFIAKQLACLDYQSCETDDWPQTRAYAFCAGLRDQILTWLPDYESAPWGLSEYPHRERATA